MRIYNVAILLLIVAVSRVNQVLCQMLPECHAWSEIEDRIKLESSHLSCIKNSNCTGMNCTGSVRGEEFHAGLQIHHCENPSFITALADIPQLGIHNWQRSFTHGSMFDLSGNIKGELSLVKEKDKFIIGLSLNILTGVEKYFPELTGAPLKFPVFNGTSFPISSCQSIVLAPTKPVVGDKATLATYKKKILDPKVESKTHIIGNCSINNSSCRREEVCVQLDKSYSDGICNCRPLYTRNETGLCIYTPESLPSTESNIIPVPESQAASDSGPSTPVARTAILISVTTILLLIGIVYVVYRFKVFQYLRRKFRAQVYEHVLLGQQDDNDEPLTDPVAHHLNV